MQLCIPGSLDIQFQLIDLLLETAARGYITERNSLATAANQKKKVVLIINNWSDLEKYSHMLFKCLSFFPLLDCHEAEE